MSDQEQQPTQTQPTDEQQPFQLPPTQFLMFPEGFRINPTATPIGDCLAVTGVQMGQSAIVEATLMVPIEQVDALCDLMKRERDKATKPDIIRAGADTDLAALAAQARQRSGL